MPRILLVDDDIAEISAVKRVLARGGHQPVLATNASDALASITQEKPALLIVSSACESGDALRLARGLGDDLDTAGIPLLVLGDAADLPDGARRLARPVDPELLTAEVASCLAAAPSPPAPHPAPGAPVGKVAPARLAVPPAPQAGPLQRPPRPEQPATGAAAPTAQRPGPEHAAASRRAAADALRARAEELRRKALGGGAAPPSARAPPPGAAPDARAPRPAPRPPAVLELDDGRGALAPPPPAAPAAAPAPPAPDEVPAAEDERAARRAAADEARQQAADEALRALEEEAGAHVAEGLRARPAPAPDPAAVLAAEAVEASRRSEDERRLRESIETARREAFEAARAELEERARREAAEVARRAQAEAAAHQEVVAAAQREAGELARREAEGARLRQEAEERARAEAEGRRRAEEQLGALRAQLEEERRKAEERVATVMQRAAAEEEAADELRRMAEDEAREREEAAARLRGEEEERLRAAVAAAQAELDQLRRRSEEEARRRAEAEAALERAEAARRDEQAQRDEQARRDEALRGQEQALREEQFRRQEQALREEHLRLQEQEQALRDDQRRREEAAQRPEPAAPAEPSLFDRPDFFAPFDGAEPAAGVPAEPVADPAEEAARRRVAALRSQADPAPEPPAAPVRTPAPPPPAPPPEPAEEAEPEEPPRRLSPPPLQLRAGDLAELPAPRLLALTARVKLEGRLDFHGEVARSVWFEDGKVVGATSAEPSERVEEVALRLGLITRDQHRRMAQAASTLPSRRAALLLLERGFLKASELTGLVRRRTEEVVFGVFAELDGRFRWSGTPVPPEERTSLERGTLALAVEGVRRRWLAPRLEALLGGPATLLVPVQGAPGAAELGLSAEERRVAALADGLRTLDELAGASPLDPLSTRQVLAALVLCGALTVRLVQGGRPAAQAAAAIDLGRVKDKLDQVRRADYFSVLGVGRHGTPHEVREAADRLQGEFDPRRFAGVADEGLPARLAEILQVVQDAREVLSDERLREEYLRGLGDA